MSGAIYTPSYDTTIQTVTRTEQLPTWHLDHFDWDYPFEIPDNMYPGDPNRAALRERFINLLLKVEEVRSAGGNVSARFAHGCSRWDIISHGMCSCWPYWSPRPTLLRLSPMGGSQREDWLSIRDVRVES